MSESTGVLREPPSPFVAAWAVFRRELGGYFATPVAYVFIVVFLLLAGVFTFALGGLYERGQADLQPLFNTVPWLFLFLIPAVSMRLWSEERRGGSIELLVTMPAPIWSSVIAKFLAAWAFTLLALALTFPAWVTVSRLGEPDHGAILAGYAGSALMAGAFLAVGACVSAATKSQVIAFVLGASACMVFVLAGFGPVIEFLRGWAPGWLVEGVGALGFLTRAQNFARGVIELADLVYFATVIAAALIACAAIINAKKAD
ncbi:MAG: ABC transporter permease [Planctomycetota bacterium]